MDNRLESIEYDVDAECYRATYDPGTTAPSVAVVEIVETIFDRDRGDYELLYDVLDPEALDRVLESSAKRSRRGPLSVGFPFQGSRVTVTSDGRITVQPRSEDEG